MRIAAHRGNRLHAPENTLTALISGYTGGADALAFELQLTADDQLLLCHDATTERVAGTAGVVAEMRLAELRRLDFSETFAPRHSQGFAYYPGTRRMAPATFAHALEALPEEVELLIELIHPPGAADARRETLVRATADTIAAHNIANRVVVCSRDADALRGIRRALPQLRIVTRAEALPPQAQIELMREVGADGLATALEAVFADGELTGFGRLLQAAHADGALRVGAILRPQRSPAVFEEAEWRALRDQAFVWALCTDSTFDTAFCRPSLTLIDEAFAGIAIDRERFAFGYAKANRYAVVGQDDGVHIRIGEYAFPPEPTDPLERRLQSLHDRLVNVAREWPYYSGGGVGCIQGVRGDFAAEVDYTAERVGQATTLEMAALNVDPGAHRGAAPASFRDKDSFYDPHGAPPYVGVEHDEDDGMRINWNLGTEYDNNQYGRPVGDGTVLGGRLRLERRGAYFSAYYRNDADARDWVCCGVARNDSLNPVVYLRCVGKRWRQESETDPSVYLPVIPNHFVFRHWRIVRHPQPSRSG